MCIRDRALEPELHGQVDLDTVAVFPRPRDRQVARRAGRSLVPFSVDLDGANAGDPTRYPDAEGERDRFRSADDERRLRLFGEARFLTDLDAFFLPVELGGDEQVDEESAAVVEIDAVAVLGVVLHPRPRTAPERVVGLHER